MNVYMWYSLLWGYCIVKLHEYCTMLRDKFWFDKPWIPLWESWVLWWQIHIKKQKKNKISTGFGFEKARSLQLVSERLVWFLRIDDNNVVVIYFKMVHTRQGMQTEPPSIEGRNRGWNAQDWQVEDPLDDTVSHTLVRASESMWGKKHRSWRRWVPNWTEKVPPTRAEQQERTKAHPLTIPTGVPSPYTDLGLLVQIVKAVMEGMVGSTTQATPVTQIPWTTPGIVATTDNVVLLIWLVKSMSEMGYESYIGKKDAEIAGRWIKKVEKTMIQINILENLQVNCVTQLLSDWVMTWWETFHLRCVTETLTWRDFKLEFENQFYSRYHHKVKE